MKVVTLVIGLFLFYAPVANACDIVSLFSKDPNIVLPQFSHNDASIMDNVRGDMDVPIRGNNLCADLPEDSRATLVFMGNKLVQVKVTNNVPGELLDFAEKNYGKAKNRPADLKQSKTNFQNVWAGDDNHLVMYSVSKQRGVIKEYLEFTSKKEKKTMEEFYAAQEEEINNFNKSKVGKKKSK